MAKLPLLSRLLPPCHVLVPSPSAGYAKVDCLFVFIVSGVITPRAHIILIYIPVCCSSYLCRSSSLAFWLSSVGEPFGFKFFPMQLVALIELFFCLPTYLPLSLILVRFSIPTSLSSSPSSCGGYCALLPFPYFYTSL